MTQRHYEQLWAVILAGGNGTRVQSFLAEFCDGSGIKQFSAIIGRRSMLQHTVSRVERIVRGDQIFVSLNQLHYAEAIQQLPQLPLANLIFQPRNIDTAAGILLPLAHITHRDPSSTIAVFPSDHFIEDEETFMAYVEDAVRESRNHPDVLVLLGVAADTPDEGYGWIEPAGQVDGSLLREVRSFREKPLPAEAHNLIRLNCLWNIFVLVGRAEVFWDIVSDTVPELYRAFWTVRFMLNSAHAQASIEHIYHTARPVNFSSEILARAQSRLRVLEVPKIGWSDWGTKERILDSLKKTG